MKTLFALLILFSSVSVFARLSEPQQLAIVQKIAKEHRRQMHIQNFEDVQSHVEKISKGALDELMKKNPEVEIPLTKEEVSSLYRCLNSQSSCSLFLISLTGSIYGGSGETHNYVLLDPKTGKVVEIMHEVFAE